MTEITMDWTDKGATVEYKASVLSAGILPSIACPRCGIYVVANSGKHVCGDHAPKTKVKRKVAK